MELSGALLLKNLSHLLPVYIFRHGPRQPPLLQALCLRTLRNGVVRGHDDGVLGVHRSAILWEAALHLGLCDCGILTVDEHLIELVEEDGVGLDPLMIHSLATSAALSGLPARGEAEVLLAVLLGAVLVSLSLLPVALDIRNTLGDARDSDLAAGLDPFLVELVRNILFYTIRRELI